MTVSGATPRKAKREKAAIDVSHLPPPNIPLVEGSWSVLVSGIGGAGVVTIGQTLAVAAHADGYYSSNLDITGLAQKYGAVHSHIKIAESPDRMRATRIATGEADALIGCDLVVAAGDEALSTLKSDDAVAVTDTTVVPTAEFSKNPDWQLSGAEQLQRLTRTLGERARGLDAQTIAEQVMGDRVFANMLLLGASWQQGGIPLSLEAIHRAIELNGVQIKQNVMAFDLGRLTFADPEAVARMISPAAPIDLASRRLDKLPNLIEHRTKALTSYQDVRFAKRYSDTMARVAKLDEASRYAVAKGYYKLLAIKDEWEVARLYSDPAFRKGLKETFDGELKLTFHVGAWPFGRVSAATGKPVKGEAGPWLLSVFGLMARLRFLRGSVVDPFRNNAEAKLARQVMADYEADIDFALANAAPENATQVAELLDLPKHIRGYGHVRVRHVEATKKMRDALRAAIIAEKKQPKEIAS